MLTMTIYKLKTKVELTLISQNNRFNSIRKYRPTVNKHLQCTSQHNFSRLPVRKLPNAAIRDRGLQYHRDLLYVKYNNTSHYVYNSDFKKLVRKQLTKMKVAIHTCKRCFAHFDSRHNKLNRSGAKRP